MLEQNVASMSESIRSTCLNDWKSWINVAGDRVDTGSQQYQAPESSSWGSLKSLLWSTRWSFSRLSLDRPSKSISSRKVRESFFEKINLSLLGFFEKQMETIAINQPNQEILLSSNHCRQTCKKRETYISLSRAWELDAVQREFPALNPLNSRSLA